MSSNNCHQFNYPYQQSSAQQQYSAYQTSPASNNVAPPPRQYQQPPTTQAQDYMSYQPQSYANQNSGFGTGQTNSWNGNNYGGTRETTSQAAEVLRNMSNPSYTTNSTAATSQAGFTAASATASNAGRYATGNSHSPQVQAQSVYAQSQPRPRSVNANRTQPASRGLPSPTVSTGHPSQRAQTIYNQQQQLSASPAQAQYNTTPANNARSAATTATKYQQHSEYSGRQLPNVEASRSSQNPTSSTGYNYRSAQMPSGANAPPAPTANMAESYSAQNTTTVDPLAVYDPWPEYQRKQAAQKAMEEARRAEEERIAEEARKAEEKKQEEVRKRQEEEESRLRQSQSSSKTTERQQPATAEMPSAATAGGDAAQVLEAQIREMMAKMRELNRQDPALLARIWEEERKAKPKSPTVQHNAPAQVAPAPPVQPVQASTPQVVSSRKKTVPKETVVPQAPPRPTASVVAQAVPVRQPQAPAPRPTGNTVWPPEKKANLASAAATYLNAQNDVHKIDPSQVLSLLNCNPSYIELCEQLEQMGLKLDRAGFAKNLLTAVPDVNSTPQKSEPKPAPVPAQKPRVPSAVMKREVATHGVPSPQARSAVALPANRESYPPFPDHTFAAATPAPVAEMVPLNPELRKPANKEEAARKRNLSDLVDLTQLSDEEEMGPPSKRLNSGSVSTYASPYPLDAMQIDQEPVTPNIPIAHTPAPAHPPQASIPQPIQPPGGQLRYNNFIEPQVVEPLDKKKALRRNNYNPATIARDVLLACGRHPSQRNLNQHLDVLRTTLPQFSFDSDLSTIRWDIIDPGNPPPGYFKSSVQALTEDADDEDDSDDEGRAQHLGAPANAIGGEGGAKVQALPEAINPFIKQKRRGRPPRHSLPDNLGPKTPTRPMDSSSMSASAPRSSTPGSAGIGYAAFRSATEYGPDGKPLPKKKGRPVGWRKAVHGSAAAQSSTGVNNKHQPSQPSSLRNERIHINSRSPSVVPHYPEYKCKWQSCNATLHNLETLQKHVFKVHGREPFYSTFVCRWDDCGKEGNLLDPMTNTRLENHPPDFNSDDEWRQHIQQNHFSDLSWELGDGPAGGLSDSHDSEVEAYLSDAQGRQVTPRITVESERLETVLSSWSPQVSAGRGRGRPRYTVEQQARDAHARLVLHKKRIGGPGMDRGGATLVNEKRRRGLIENDETDQELVTAED
ncbi:C2H2 finger domain-containing [Pyrenophora seminiperda CCB06]|uniref:C2H2 finger domain-containing n=1 Tax=Pyrenophora seminiperda CCB06 TaxID=1302712 RepID=A0A3M7M3Y7_9PLEO|nr:C2H2 finger domain-containing [Pyrenophora seminiperda CCB06]